MHNSLSVEMTFTSQGFGSFLSFFLLAKLIEPCRDIFLFLLNLNENFTLKQELLIFFFVYPHTVFVLFLESKLDAFNKLISKAVEKQCQQSPSQHSPCGFKSSVLLPPSSHPHTCPLFAQQVPSSDIYYSF